MGITGNRINDHSSVDMTVRELASIFKKTTLGLYQLERRVRGSFINSCSDCYIRSWRRRGWVNRDTVAVALHHSGQLSISENKHIFLPTCIAKSIVNCGLSPLELVKLPVTLLWVQAGMDEEWSSSFVLASSLTFKIGFPFYHHCYTNQDH